MWDQKIVRRESFTLSYDIASEDGMLGRGESRSTRMTDWQGSSGNYYYYQLLLLPVADSTEDEDNNL